MWICALGKSMKFQFNALQINLNKTAAAFVKYHKYK